jgi:hypothetical protein
VKRNQGHKGYTLPKQTSNEKMLREVRRTQASFPQVVDLDLSARKNIIKNIASKIHQKHLYSTTGFSELGLNVNKIEEFTKQ